MLLSTTEPAALPRPALRLWDCYAFFFPLVLMVELNMISKSVIHAFLARTDAPSTALAAFNSAFTFYFALTSTVEVTALICLSFLKTRADAARLVAFMGLVLAEPAVLAVAVAVTSLGNDVFGGWFGLGTDAQAQARACVGLLVLSIPVLILRGVVFALLMSERRTIIITASTLVRLLSLALSLAVLPRWLEGAAIGAGALVVCMAAETLFAWAFAWRALARLPPRRDDRQTFAGYWRFSWPLMVNQAAEMGVIFVITLFLGRLGRAEVAIAAFGVVHGLVSLLMAPMRTLTQSAQTLVGRREDVRTLANFTGQLVAVFTLLALILFETPLSAVILQGVMGLSPELANYSEPAMSLAFLMAGFWSATALFRGLLAKARTTGSLAASGVLRVLTAAAAGSLSLAHPEINGAVLGVAAWILSYAVETVISWWRLARIGWFVEK